jgi:type I restriction enzyme S subunit
MLGELSANEPNSITDGPFGSNLKTAHYVESGPRVIRLQNIGDGYFVDSGAHISSEHFQLLQKHRVFEGDLVIAALGQNLPRACLIPGSVGPAVVKADCIRFKAHPRLADPRFLNWMPNAEPTRRRTTAVVHGVGRPRMNLGAIKSIPLPIAPLVEQRRIVAAIEEQFTRLDAAVASLQRARANLRRYRAAVLATAFEGRLVPSEAALARLHGRSYETGEQLWGPRTCKSAQRAPAPATRAGS